MTTQTGAYIVTKAYERAGLMTIGGTPSTAQFQRGIDALNDIINLEATQGLKLWLVEDISIPLTAGKTTYSMGAAGDVNMTKPLQVFQGYYQYTNASKLPLVLLSKDEWTRLSQTNIPGSLNSFYPDKQLSYIYINFYNTPDATTAGGGVAHVIARTAPTNLVVTTDTTGFPPEWYLFLIWSLADEMAVSQPADVQQRCQQRAGMYRAALEGFDVEDAQTFFTPDTRMMYRQGEFR